jgi:hypothetical protein
MSYTSDHDGKSKTASAVDQEHYPEQHEVENAELDAAFHPAHEQIAIRACELWHSRGCPEGTADQDWFEAEQELRATKPLNGTQGKPSPTGSVQH